MHIVHSTLSPTPTPAKKTGKTRYELFAEEQSDKVFNAIYKEMQKELDLIEKRRPGYIMQLRKSLLPY